MSLRSRLLLLFGTLLVVMLAAAAWWSQWLATSLSAQMDEAAVSLGRSVVSVVDEERARSKRPGPDTPPEVEVVVERSIRQDDRVIRAIHREVDGTIVEFSTQVNDQPAQIVAIPEQSMIWEPKDLRFTIRAIREGEETGPGRLEFMGAHVQRDIPIPEQGLKAVVDRFSRQMFLGLLALFAAGLMVAALIAHRVSDPLRRLQRAADRIGAGELGVQVEGRGVSEVNAAVQAFNDMSSQLVQLEDARQALRAQQHLSEIGEIGRGLAHSLRNPLNAIGLSVEELSARAGDAPEHRQLADDVRRQIQRIDASIRAFLTLANAPDAEPSTVDLREIVQDVALEVVQQVGRQIDVHVKAPDQPLEMLGLDTELRAMIQALVVNAAEASPVRGVVEIQLLENAEQRELVVRDQGPGLSDAIRERLFQPHATTKADGSGMGLYLTRRLASDRYRGGVALSEREGGGVEARLWLADRRKVGS